MRHISAGADWSAATGAQYEIAGHGYQAVITEVGAALRVLRHHLFPRAGYPYSLRLEASYSLAADGLTWQVTAVNVGAAPAPYGCAPHPYLVAGEGRVDDWSLELPADEYLEVTPDRLLPAGTRPVAGTEYDFRRLRQIGATAIDHAFTGLRWDGSGAVTARLLRPDGRGVAVRWDRGCRWVQVHTADRPEPELHRAGLALEPMTCPPDAFNSGVDLVVLAPGDAHRASWIVSAVG